MSNEVDASAPSAPRELVTAYEQLTIDTPEQIALEFPLAGVGSRSLAVAVDSLIQIAVAVVVLFVGFLLGIGAGSIVARLGGSNRAIAVWVFAVSLLVAFTVWYGYFAVFEIVWRGQTPGKRLLGLRVISADGRPMTPLQAILRNLLRIVDQLPGLYAVGIASVLLSARNQRLGDLAAGTVVVREQTTEALQMPQDEMRLPPQRAKNATLGAPAHDRLRANRLTEQELALIERFLERRSALDVEIRGSTGQQIAARVRERLGIADGDVSDEDLLERVLTEYRSFGSYR